jgi:2-phospho-L-lactate guanylyltransferase
LTERSAPRVVALVPVKPLAGAKSRLAALGSPRREALVLALAERTLRAAVRALGAGDVALVGGDDRTRQVARDAGAQVWADHGSDLNSGLWLAMQRAFAEGADGALYLPADLPALTPEDVRAVVRASRGCTHPAGARAATDGGTNALLLPATAAFAPLLGHDSFARHVHACAAAGTPLVRVRRRGFAADADTPDDVARALAAHPGLARALAAWERRLAQEDARG